MSKEDTYPLSKTTQSSRQTNYISEAREGTKTVGGGREGAYSYTDEVDSLPAEQRENVFVSIVHIPELCKIDLQKVRMVCLTAHLEVLGLPDSPWI
jgi:hypothetical protein